MSKEGIFRMSIQESAASSGLSTKGSSGLSTENSSGLWEIRTEEQDYAFLSDEDHRETNRYGQLIDLIDLTDQKAPINRSLHINDNPEVGCNPNRNKQHGFYFDADNCTGCHACESACAEKNETPAHIAYRSVGYVEGGSYPDYQRLNISMACNHCDDPVCLKGCPTGAYTKHAEYGAVLQDPDTCFGCGYCTWVCPYNAPQLDPIEGHVSKCNMCVDRLEVGLKPACVSACVGNALDFGIIENVPDNRYQVETQIPGFPSPEITHPNIRFQQVRELPDEMKRTDDAPVKYRKSKSGQFQPVLDPKGAEGRGWNLGGLISNENPLVLFTLMTQASIGSFLIAFLGIQIDVPGFRVFAATLYYPIFLIVCLGLVSMGLLMSTMHLGKPFRFYRGFNNLRHSPVCREGLGISVYMGFLGMHFLLQLPGNLEVQFLVESLLGVSIPDYSFKAQLMVASNVCGIISVPAALAGLYYMNRCYRIPARPFWNHWQVATSFSGNSISLGSIIFGLFFVLALSSRGELSSSTPNVPGLLMMVGLVIEMLGLYFHRKAMRASNNEGGVSHHVQTSRFGYTYIVRNLCLVISIVLGSALLALRSIPEPSVLFVSWGLIGLCVIATSLVGRALFYVLVIPTTMPGAFFWKNKGFEEHARESGLANLPQVGVVPLSH
jgi:DMSO reductase iron-sulfur subunit